MEKQIKIVEKLENIFTQLLSRLEDQDNFTIEEFERTFDMVLEIEKQLKKHTGILINMDDKLDEN